MNNSNHLATFKIYRQQQQKVRREEKLKRIRKSEFRELERSLGLITNGRNVNGIMYAWALSFPSILCRKVALSFGDFHTVFFPYPYRCCCCCCCYGPAFRNVIPLKTRWSFICESRRLHKYGKFT